MRHDIVRRFEVYAERKEVLEEVRRQLRGASVGITEDVDARAINVSFHGDASVAAKIRERVARIQGARIIRDFLEVPAAVPRPPAMAKPGDLAVAPGDDEARYPDQAALLRIDPDGRSRNEQGTGARVVVAIVDSGIMVDHPALKGYLWTAKVDGQDVHGARCMGDQRDHDLTDQDGHGTMLAGSILATANSVGGLELMGVKFFDFATQPSAANAAQAIRFAVANGAHIINLSFDLGIGSNELEQAIASAGRAGVLVVMAAGNTGSDNDQYPLVPARYAESCRESAIVVMATDSYDGRAMISNFGRRSVDLAAPGVRIWSTCVSRGGAGSRKYGAYTGTSAATAQVSGAAALLKSQDPSRTASDIKRRLMGTVDRLPQLKCVSGGRLNLGRALT